LRAALIFGTKEGGDVALSEDKVKGMRNFANKIWNIGRFIQMNQGQGTPSKDSLEKREIIKQLQTEFKNEYKKYLKSMKKLKFSQALGDIYEFLWHRFADYYIEQLKDGVINGNIEALEALKDTYLSCLKLLHPFMPYVTEAAWKVFKGEDKSIMSETL